MLKKLLVGAAIMLWLCPVLHAEESLGEDVTKPFDYEEIEVAGTAVGLTSTKYSPSGSSIAKQAMCVVEGGQDIRFRLDGTDPTSSTGTILSSADVIYLKTYTDVSQVKFIRASLTSGTSATVNCTYRR